MAPEILQKSKFIAIKVLQKYLQQIHVYGTGCALKISSTNARLWNFIDVP